MAVVEFLKTRKRVATSAGGITGRDGFIVAKALGYAIEAIAALPVEYQEWSDREDMKAIRAALFSPALNRVVTESACGHLFHDGSLLKRNTAIDLTTEN
jgi:hypothetical protein